MESSHSEFYSPGFKRLFSDWLDSIQNYPKPYEFTLGKISEMLDFNADTLFTGKEDHEGCFAEEKNMLKDEQGRKYYISVESVLTADNTTVDEENKVFCKWSSKAGFVEDLRRKRLALERAISVYMQEGPFSTSSYDIKVLFIYLTFRLLTILGKQ
jgi:Notch-like protein